MKYAASLPRAPVTNYFPICIMQFSICNLHSDRSTSTGQPPSVVHHVTSHQPPFINYATLFSALPNLH